MEDFTPLNPEEEIPSPEAEEAPAAQAEEPVAEEAVQEPAAGEAAQEPAAEEAPAEPAECEACETVPEAAEETAATEETPAEETPEEEAAEEPAPDKLDDILASQQELSEKIDALKSLFNARIMHADHEDKVIDRMHAELQKYKEDMYAQLIRPVLLDVIEVRDSIMRMSAAYLAKPEGEQNIPNKVFADYSYDLQDILEKNSVEIYRSKPGDDFTPIRQRAVKKVPTADEALHGKVAESLSCGYSYNGRTISAEKITVYYYEKPVEKDENSEVIENG